MQETVPTTDSKNSSEKSALSRRALLRGGGAAVIAAGAATLFDESAHAQETPPPPAMRSPKHEELVATMADAGEPELPYIASIAFTRMAFGASPTDWAAFDALGATGIERLTAYVDQQLNPAAINDDACDAKIAAQGFTTLAKSADQLWSEHVIGDQDRNLPLDETVRATFLRAVYSKRQLQEVLADYWHNHFNVSLRWQWASPTFVQYDRDIIRKHLFGNFRTLLEAVAQSPAMLYFLDNQYSSGERPNENFARELFELHVMGSENYFGIRSIDDPDIKDEEGKRLGYIDSDVYGATTCFTGWQVDEDTGRFQFNEADHFPYTKIVMGQVIPEFQGVKDGKDVLDLIAYHPASARYICRRLCRRLISDNPPESIVQAAADVFIANKNAPDQLKKVVRTILLSLEFRSTFGQKIKRPFEFSASLLRSIGANFVPDNNYLWNYGTIGQPLFEWRPPNGYPDDRNSWSGTMPILQRWRHCNWLFYWSIDGGEGAEDIPRLRPELLTPASLKTPGQLVDHWSNVILGRLLPSNERQTVVDFMAAGRNPDFDLPVDQIAERLRWMVALIYLSPSFQWR